MTKFSEEQLRALGNKVWMIFNRFLNLGFTWQDAKQGTIDEIAEQRETFDSSFEVDENDPLRSEAIWEVRMNQFKQLEIFTEAI